MAIHRLAQFGQNTFALVLQNASHLSGFCLPTLSKSEQQRRAHELKLPSGYHVPRGDGSAQLKAAKVPAKAKRRGGAQVLVRSGALAKAPSREELRMSVREEHEERAAQEGWAAASEPAEVAQPRLSSAWAQPRPAAAEVAQPRPSSAWAQPRPAAAAAAATQPSSSSSAAAAGAAAGTHHPPDLDALRQRNDAVVARVREALAQATGGGADLERAFASFRELSMLFRAETVTAKEYALRCASLGLIDLIPDLASILPDPAKAHALQLARGEVLREQGAAEAAAAAAAAASSLGRVSVGGGGGGGGRSSRRKGKVVVQWGAQPVR